jgi:hypothetical protein
VGKFFAVVVTMLVVVVLFAVSGDLFPEGSFLRDMADGLRAAAADMFGGGYGAVSPG